jgi:hypothetical protein
MSDSTTQGTSRSTAALNPNSLITYEIESTCEQEKAFWVETILIGYI